MANGMYNIAKHNMEIGAFNWTDGLWYAALVDNVYAPNLVTETTTASITAHILNSVVVNLASCASSAAGVLSANSVTFAGISTSQTAKAVVIYHDTGSATFPFLYLDTGTGLPDSTTGANITVDWNGVASNGPLFTL